MQKYGAQHTFNRENLFSLLMHYSKELLVHYECFVQIPQKINEEYHWNLFKKSGTIHFSGAVTFLYENGKKINL